MGYIQQSIGSGLTYNQDIFQSATQANSSNTTELLLQNFINQLQEYVSQNQGTTAEDEYNNKVMTEQLQKQRDQEYQLLKEAFNVKGDSWSTAIGGDTVANQNLQAFKDRWDKILTNNEYEDYAFNAGYGGINTDLTTGYNSLLNQSTGTTGGYI